MREPLLGYVLPPRRGVIMMHSCGYRIMAITSAFQADDAGSIPATRSNACQAADPTTMFYGTCPK